MARTGAQINAQITNYLQANYGQLGQPFYYYFNDGNGNPITPSATAIISILISCVSWDIAFFEQLNDLFLSTQESQILSAPVFTPAWIQKMLYYFQYSASNPQVIQVNISQNYPFISLSYPVVNNSYNIITQGAIITTTNGTVLIKVASNSTPLTTLQLAALQSYLLQVMPVGTQWTILSVLPDQAYVQSQIYYNAAYSGVIQANVIAAITTFFANVPFNGTFEVTGLLQAILAVPGVTDCILNNVQVRIWSQAFGTGTNLVLSNDLLIRSWSSYAGYIIPETTVGQTLIDSLTFIAS